VPEVPNCRNRSDDPNQAYNWCNQTASLCTPEYGWQDGCPVGYFCSMDAYGDGFCNDIPTNDW
jgi:hypothetical protein